MPAQDMKISELVAKIARNEIRLPEMQRRYVWKQNQVRDLLDSLYRGYPSGTILTWETDEDVVTRDFAVTQDAPTQNYFQLLLDGQQRLTSLRAILDGKRVTVSDRVNTIDILFNLDHPEKPEETLEADESDDATDEDDVNAEVDLKSMTFAVSNPTLENLPNWVSVTKVFTTNDDTPLLEELGIVMLNDPRYNRYKRRLERLRNIKDYLYRVEVLGREKSYVEVADIFVRVNSLGTRLRPSDLALAQITAKWQGSLINEFEPFEKECKENGFAIPLAIIVRSIIVFAKQQGSFKLAGSLSLDELKTAWGIVKDEIGGAIDFLRSRKIDNPVLLSSLHFILPLALYRHSHEGELSREEAGRLAYWVHVASMKGRYSSGSADAILNQDLQAATERNIGKLLSNVEAVASHLEVTLGDLRLGGKDSRSLYYKTMFMAFRADDACDWGTHNIISLDSMLKNNKIQSHHIFPKAVLKEAGVPPDEMDDICNLAFITAQTNNSRRVGSRPPHEYLQDFINENGEEFKSQLRKQCIPTDTNLWQVDRYKDFLEKRRELIADRLNAFLMGIKEA